MAAVNADDAVAITAEFFASLDNVQAEAAFLLEEIRLKDIAIMEHLRKAESRGNSLYRSVRQPPAPPAKDASQPPTAAGNGNSSSSTILNPSTPKDSQNHSRVMAEYTKVEALQEEKMVLADTLTRIVTRHRERARDEWRRIVGDDAVSVWDAQQEEELSRAHGQAGQVTLGAIAWKVATGVKQGGSVAGLVGQLLQKGGFGGSSGMSTPAGDDRISKKRKSSHLPGTPGASAGVGGGGYFDVPPLSSRTGVSANTAAAAGGGSPHPLSAAYVPQTTVTYSHTQREKKSRRHASEVSDLETMMMHGARDMDVHQHGLAGVGAGAGAGAGRMEADGAVGEEGADGAAADETLYCFCQEKSHGQMIGCDNETCRFEWFHVKCMKLDPDKLPETWFCPECVKILGYSSSAGEKAVTGGAGEKAGGYKKGNKGRKK
ncbi:hypothetical protein QFC22_006124 [Naganishia vaughanmartiniae]|uniref:Uncharacterized protein n=1 Tax=Naganishia vaughanmartiniae TaxID=1424756 RepID=A0ACC2WNN6_9TREE|nr:hypothetical protein QFC22_006124 [Naganishia vaughanmartiniae]